MRSAILAAWGAATFLTTMPIAVIAGALGDRGWAVGLASLAFFGVILIAIGLRALVADIEVR